MRRFLFLIFLFLSLQSSSIAGNFFYGFSIKDEVTIDSLKENSLTNPNNILGLSQAQNILIPKLNLSLFYSDNLSFELRPRVDFLLTSNKDMETTIYFSELYANYQFGNFSVDLGEEIVSWGTAYAWNPTNVLVAQRNFQNWTGERIGLQLARVQYFPLQNLAFTGVTVLDNKNKINAIKTYILTDDTDLNFSLSGGNDHKAKPGFSFARVFGEDLEIHGEIAFQKGSDRYFPKLLIPTQEIYALEKTKYDDNVIYSWLVMGGQYTTSRNTNIIFEYYYNGDGMNANEYELFKEAVQACNSNKRYAHPISPNPWLGFLLDYASNYFFANLRQNYLFMRITQTDMFNKIDTSLMSFYNVDDRSMLVMPEITNKLNNHINIYSNSSFFVGENDTEFGGLYNNKVTLGMEIFF